MPYPFPCALVSVLTLAAGLLPSAVSGNDLLACDPTAIVGFCFATQIECAVNCAGLLNEAVFNPSDGQDCVAAKTQTCKLKTCCPTCGTDVQAYIDCALRDLCGTDTSCDVVGPGSTPAPVASPTNAPTFARSPTTIDVGFPTNVELPTTTRAPASPTNVPTFARSPTSPAPTITIDVGFPTNVELPTTTRAPVSPTNVPTFASPTSPAPASPIYVGLPTNVEIPATTPDPVSPTNFPTNASTQCADTYDTFQDCLFGNSESCDPNCVGIVVDDDVCGDSAQFERMCREVTCCRECAGTVKSFFNCVASARGCNFNCGSAASATKTAMSLLWGIGLINILSSIVV